MGAELRSAKLPAETVARLKNMATLNKTTIHEIAGKALEPVLQKMERETYARFHKSVCDKTTK